ncbi:AAA family ATPase [Endozoicomonas acroporae]|uniref:AAA family ATPase n=1 Tax=Endozoicomonas acroporae TaxID=1701104 RepID=UPI000C7728EF|nr:AAA family ATPase [Endozoicomonas acroporae]
MQLDQITYQNFRSFKQATLRLHKHLTVIVGANGAGKTASMEGIAVAMGTFIGSFDEAKGSGFKTSDAHRLRLNPDSPDCEPQYPITISAIGSLQPEHEQQEWSRSLTGKKSSTTTGDAKYATETAKQLQNGVRNNSTDPLPVVALYGAGRLWGANRLTKTKRQTLSESRTLGYHESMNPVSGYKEFAYWFKQLFQAHLQLKMEKMQQGSSDLSTPYDATIHVVQETVDKLLKHTGWHSVMYDAAMDEIAAEHPDIGRMPVSMLSDGVRNVLGLAADIAFRCCKLNPQFKEAAAKKTRGLVMIDEVDMYLHPSWQQTLVDSLRDAFPAIQFILTTHSPHVLSTVASESIRILDNGVFYDAPQGTKGAEASRILDRVFHVKSRPEHDPNTLLLKEYLDLVYADQWSSKAALDKRQKLDEIFQGEEPALLEADLYIENRQWELDGEEDQ